MDIKERTPEQPMDQRNNQKEKLKIPRNKGKWKHNISKLEGCRKSSLRVKFVVINTNLRKKNEDLK